MTWGTQHPASRNFPAARRGETELFPVSQGVIMTRSSAGGTGGEQSSGGCGVFQQMASPSPRSEERVL